MVKTLLTSALLLLAVGANAQKNVLTQVTAYSLEDQDTIIAESYGGVRERNYYDAQNRLSLQVKSGDTYTYKYAADGKIATVDISKVVYATGLLAYSATQTYYYSAEGLLDSIVSTDGTATKYSDYKNGVAQKEESVGLYSTTTTSYRLTFDDQNRLTKKERETENPDSVDQTTTYTYNADGTIATETVFAYGTYYNSWYRYDYIYTEVDGKYAPQNVKPVTGDNNTVSLTWDAVEGASRYAVLFNAQVDTVDTPAYTTDVLKDAEYTFNVQTIINGTVGVNISEAVTATVEDKGKLPASDFKLIVEGEIEKVESPWLGNTYNFTFQWTNPETESVITGYKIYFGEGVYDYANVPDSLVDHEGKVCTVIQGLGDYVIRNYEFDMTTYSAVYTDGKPLTMTVVVVYETGESKRSNEITANLYDIYLDPAGYIAGVKGVKEDRATEAVEYYSVSGARLSNAQKGINLVKKADGSVKKILVK